MKQYLFDQFTAIRLHTGLAYSHDGKQIALSQITLTDSGQENLLCNEDAEAIEKDN